MVKHDDAGEFPLPLVKLGQNNTARDDVAAALVLAGGAFYRANAAPGASSPICNGMSRAHRRLNKGEWGRARWSAALERDGWRCVNRFAVPFHPAASKTGLNEPRYLVELPLFIGTSFQAVPIRESDPRAWHDEPQP